MKVRYKLAGAPVAYTLSQVRDAREGHEALHGALWAADAALAARVKELVFLRISGLNACEV